MKSFTRILVVGMVTTAALLAQKPGCDGDGDSGDGDDEGDDQQQQQSAPRRIRTPNWSGDETEATNLFAVTDFQVVASNQTVAFTVAWNESYLAAMDSRYADIFFSTNLRQSAAPQLDARFKGVPEHIPVDWRCLITSERTERRSLDDRTFPATGWSEQFGSAPYDITAAINEIVGGVCTVEFRVNETLTGSTTFSIRGKNPLDADAKAYIDATVDADFQAFAWLIARHETRSGSQVYNQFNVSGSKAAQPNKSNSGTGWGMCQIDRGTNTLISTSEVWDWHTNVESMNAILRQKQGRQRAFFSYYREAYGNTVNWCEPPATHTINGLTLSAEQWGAITLYNGANGIHPQTVSEHTFKSPWEFQPATGQWVLHTNQNNYAVRIANEQIQTVTE